MRHGGSMNSEIREKLNLWVQSSSYDDDGGNAYTFILKTILEKIKKVKNINGIEGIISRRDVNKAVKDLFKEKQ